MSCESPVPVAVDLRRLSEETANQLTHGLGMALAIMGAIVLMASVVRGGPPWQIIGCGVYAFTLVALYTASTLSHSFETPRWRHFFRTADQVCIFLLIAGTFTPFGLKFTQGTWSWALFAAIWALAFVGIGVKLFHAKLNNVGTLTYVMLGWLPIIAMKQIIEIVPLGAVSLLLLGGLCYTAGTLFLTRDDRGPYFHAVWHVLVLAGSICHYTAVMLYVVPMS